jgi:hypothetical protein
MAQVGSLVRESALLKSDNAAPSVEAGHCDAGARDFLPSCSIQLRVLDLGWLGLSCRAPKR